MTNAFATIARGVLAGEAASAFNADYRVYALPPKRVGRVRTLSLLADETRTTTVPRPFTHAAPPAVLHPGPGEALEWFTFSARQHAHSLGLQEWRALAETEPPVRSRIGTKLALQNLRAGAEPPQSGHDNAHYFDDIAMVRALAAVAIVGGDGARDAAIADASVTHALDGVWCAEATVQLATALIAGASAADAVAAAMDALPAQTWSRRMAEASLAVAADAGGALDRARRLSVEVGDWIYSYPIAAPETLGFLLAHVSAAESAEELMLGVLAQPRNAASLPAVAGAIAALRFGEDWIAGDLRLEDARLTGLSVASFAGRTVTEAIG